MATHVIDESEHKLSGALKRLQKALLMGISVAVALPASGAHAQTVIDNTYPGPFPLLVGDGETLTITSDGSVIGDYLAAEPGVQLNSGAQGTINNAGTINGTFGIYDVGVGASLGLTNSGNILGAQQAIFLDGGVGIRYLDNSGTISGGGYGIILQGATDLNNLTNSGTIEGLANDGIRVEGGGDIRNLTNSGTIKGTANGVYATSGTIDNLHNLAGGQILGEGGATYGVAALAISNSSNAGRISGEGTSLLTLSAAGINNFTNTGEIGGGTFGINASNNGNISNFYNHGLIHGNYGIVAVQTIYGLINTGTIRANKSVGADAAIFITLGDLIGLDNAGLIENNDSAAADKYAIQLNAGKIVGLVNSGTIQASNSGTGGGYAIEALEIDSLTNSGKIFADLDSAAIQTVMVSDTDLTLLPGSVIQGEIYVSSILSNDRLFVGQGLNLATQFSNPFSMVETYGALYTAVGAGGKDPTTIAVVDTSALAGQDNALSDLTGAISNTARDQLAITDEENNWWAKSIGGLSQINGGGPATNVNHFFGGAVTGADAIVSSNLTMGLYGGFSAGFLDVAVENGHNIDSMSYFAGGYGQFDADAFYLNFGLTAGVTNNSSNRLVANNLVLGGLETATANYNSYFVSPEVTLGTELINTGDVGFNPSLRVRYAYQQSDGYAETGTVAPLTAGPRGTQVLDARLQLAMPINNFDPGTQFKLRAGVDGRLVLANGSFDAQLLGTTTSGFNPGGMQSSVAGFVGADFSHAVSATGTIFASAEFGTGTETALRAEAEAGVKFSF